MDLPHNTQSSFFNPSNNILKIKNKKEKKGKKIGMRAEIEVGSNPRAKVKNFLVGKQKLKLWGPHVECGPLGAKALSYPFTIATCRSLILNEWLRYFKIK